MQFVKVQAWLAFMRASLSARTPVPAFPTANPGSSNYLLSCFIECPEYFPLYLDTVAFTKRMLILCAFSFPCNARQSRPSDVRTSSVHWLAVIDPSFLHLELKLRDQQFILIAFLEMICVTLSLLIPKLNFHSLSSIKPRIT